MQNVKFNKKLKPKPKLVRQNAFYGDEEYDES